MTDNTSISIIILSFIAFIYLIVWGSLNYLEEGAIFLSFITMLEAIFVLFVAYERLRDSLEERLGASQ